MGLFSRKPTKTVEKFGLELSGFATTYAVQGRDDLAQYLSVDPSAINLVESSTFHLWGASTGLVSFDEPTAHRLMGILEQGFVKPTVQHFGQLGCTAEEASVFHRTRLEEYADAHSISFLRLTDLFCKNITSEILPVLNNDFGPEPGFVAQQAVGIHLEHYLASVPKFIEDFRP